MPDTPLPEYLKIDYWINLVLKRGALAVAEVAGTILLFRSIMAFQLAPALLGAFLITLGLVFEYLTWIKAATFAARRVQQLDEAQQRLAAQHATAQQTLVAQHQGAAQEADVLKPKGPGV